jgi:hypothetical protein
MIVSRRIFTPAAALLVATLAPATASAAEPASGIQRLAWLRGCWETTSPERTVEEHWMAPRGGSMVGMGRTVRGRDLVEYELAVIREQGEKLAYEAHPSGQPSATFVSDAVSGKSVVFQNLGHDFPKRIGYERGGEDELLAWIDGGPDSERPRIEFAYKRVACDPARGVRAGARKARRP